MLAYRDVSAVNRNNPPSVSKTTLIAIVETIGVVVLVSVIVGAYCKAGNCKDY